MTIWEAHESALVEWIDTACHEDVKNRFLDLAETVYNEISDDKLTECMGFDVVAWQREIEE